MESSIALGDDLVSSTTTSQRNYNTFTKRTAKEVAAKMSGMELDGSASRRSVESRTVENGTTSVVKRTTSSQRVITTEHRDASISIEGGAVESSKSSRDHQRHERDSSRGGAEYNVEQKHRHRQETSKRDYVNAQHAESRQRQETSRCYNSSQASSAEFRQAIGGSVERSQVDANALLSTKTSHHRKNVISSSSADVTNSVLHRRGGTASSTEALHTISSTAADQKKSISNLAETGQYISNSSQSSDRRSLTSLHRSAKEGNPWASSTYERPQRIVRQDNLTVGGKFYSTQSEARSYGNFGGQRVERVHR